MAEPLSPSTEFWRISYICLGRDRIVPIWSPFDAGEVSGLRHPYQPRT
jgi:hypothetical protein